jgi:hypothetical protein
MAGSGFAITIPDDWTVQIAAPDRDITTAAPGDAWEALHAQSADGMTACSVAVGVATTSLAGRSGVGFDGAMIAPAWDEDEPTLLRVPEPRLASTIDYGYVAVTSQERFHADDPHIDHDITYAISCLAGRDLGSEGTVGRELDAIMETLEIVPLGD